MHLPHPWLLQWHLGYDPLGTEMQSPIHLTCCSMDTIMFVNTDGLPGPLIVNKLGKPEVPRPKKCFAVQLDPFFEPA